MCMIEGLPVWGEPSLTIEGVDLMPDVNDCCELSVDPSDDDVARYCELFTNDGLCFLYQIPCDRRILEDLKRMSMEKQVKDIDCKHRCGECCWMGFEATDGTGFCVKKGEMGAIWGLHTDCRFLACDKFIDRDEVRHSAAVLLLYKRAVNNPLLMEEMQNRFSNEEIDRAIEVVTKYVNVLTKVV